MWHGFCVGTASGEKWQLNVKLRHDVVSVCCVQFLIILLVNGLLSWVTFWPLFPQIHCPDHLSWHHGPWRGQTETHRRQNPWILFLKCKELQIKKQPGERWCAVDLFKNVSVNWLQLLFIVLWTVCLIRAQTDSNCLSTDFIAAPEQPGQRKLSGFVFWQLEF